MENNYRNINVEPIYPDLTTPPGIRDDIKPDTVAEEEISSIDDPTYMQAVEENFQSIESVFNVSSFNPKDYLGIVKTSNGQIKNHGDSYPVDRKIVELESHVPKLTPGSTVDQMMIATEKRLSQLENVLSTTLRYLHRLSSRVNVNCIYYGGQDVYNKYNCIRCLDDDLVNDCMSVSIDQCLNCSRYEPIIGQVYDIIDDSERNATIALDNTQLSYTMIEDLATLSRIEEMHKEKAYADIASMSKEQPKTNKDCWTESFEMDWTEKPLDGQLADIASYKHKDGPLYDANDIKSEAMKYIEQTNTIISSDFFGGSSSSDFDLEYHLEGDKTDPFIAKCIERAQKHASDNNIQAVLNSMTQNNYMQNIIDESKKYSIDPLIVLSIIGVESTGNLECGKTGNYVGLMQIAKGEAPIEEQLKPVYNIRRGVEILNAKKKAVKPKFPNCYITAYNSGQGNLLTTNSDGDYLVVGYKKQDKNQIRWIDFAKAYKDHLASKNWGESGMLEACEYFLKVVYWYNALYAKIKATATQEAKDAFLSPEQEIDANATKYDGLFKMPFKKENLPKIIFYSDYGPRTYKHNGKTVSDNHKGIDLSPLGGINYDILAIADGVVIDAGQLLSSNGTDLGWRVKIEHANGYESRYYHLEANSISVKKDDKVVAGQVIGRCGKTGYATGVHLHFEILYNNDFIDPKLCYKNLSSRYEKILI